MNNMNTKIDRRGIILTDNVNMDYIRSIEPRYNEEFCKFVIDKEKNKVCIGMDVHAQCDLNNGENIQNLFGGNIFFDDGHIEYESTLNIQHNTKSLFYKNNRKQYPNPRIIYDPALIEEINACLLAWVVI